MSIVLRVRQDLKDQVDQEYKERSGSFSKEDYQSYGVRTPDVRVIAKKYWRQIRRLPVEEIFSLCEELLEYKVSEEQMVAFAWAFSLKSRLKPEHNEIFYQWLEKYVDTWFKCDDFCTHAFGYLLYKYPRLVTQVLDWAESDNRWIRRAAAVALLYSLRKKEQFELALQVADKLLMDEDDLVQKGYGWMLKEATKHWPEEVFEFVCERKDKMPRTALRYAIEKLPKEKKKIAMS